MNEKIKVIVNSLLAGTKSGFLKWSSATFLDQYKLDFNGATIEIQRLESVDDNYIVFKIKNKNGETVFETNTGIIKEDEKIKYIELYDIVKDKANLISETLDIIIDQLNLDID